MKFDRLWFLLILIIIVLQFSCNTSVNISKQSDSFLDSEFRVYNSDNINKGVNGYNLEFTSNLLNSFRFDDGPITAGYYEVGTNDSSNILAYPRHKVKLDSFYLTSYPILNSHFHTFIDNGGYNRREFWSKSGWEWRIKNNITKPANWNNYDPDNEMLQLYPVTGISFYEAQAFCRSLTDESHSDAIRLPTEFELEVAATKGQAKLYPWSNIQENVRTTTGELRGVGVSSTECTNNSTILYDLEGLVYQWTTSKFSLYPGNNTRYNSQKIDNPNYNIVRGSSFHHIDYASRNQYRLPLTKELQDPRVGFRFLLNAESVYYVKKLWGGELEDSS